MAALVMMCVTPAGKMESHKADDSQSPVQKVASDPAPAPAPAAKPNPNAGPAEAPAPVGRSPAAPELVSEASVQPSAAAAMAATVEVDVDISKSSLIPRLLYGFNTNNSTGDYGYDDPVFQASVADLHPGVLRFPGGTVANYYHWQTGKFDAGDADDGTGPKAPGAPSGALKKLDQKRGGVVPFADFMALCIRNHVSPILVVNVYTGTPEESAAWVREVKSKGYPVSGWEIGNELYLPAYKDRFPTVASYIAVAKQHVAAMKAVDPTIKVGIVASTAGFHNQGEGAGGASDVAWDRALGKETFYDGVVVHLYTYMKMGRHDIGMDDMHGYLFGCNDIALKYAISYYRSYYGSRRLWVTEWNFANPKNGFSNTQLLAVYAGDFLLGLLQAQSDIRIASYHVFAGPGKGFALISPADQDDGGATGDVKRATYFAFKVFGDAIAASDRQVGVTVKRAPNLMSSLDYQGQRLAGIRAGGFANDTMVTILMTNRTEGDQPLAVTLGGRPVTGDVCWEAVANSDLAASNGGNAVIKGNGQDQVTTRTWCGPVNQLTLPANAVLALRIPHVSVPRPAAGPSDSALVN
jgi:hypothetical protein